MKKYNTANQKWILFGLIIPIILFYLSFGVTYAYFTASAQTIDGEITTGVIKVSVTDQSGDKVTTVSSIETEYLLPGGVVNISGYLKNSGTVPMYALLEVRLMIESGVDEDGNKTFEEGEATYYTVGGEVDEYGEQLDTECIEMELEGDRYITASTVLEKDEIRAFTIDYMISEGLDETVAGKEVNVKVVARALQYANVKDGVEATNIMLGKGADD